MEKSCLKKGYFIGCEFGYSLVFQKPAQVMATVSAPSALLSP